MFSRGFPTVSKEDILDAVTEADILYRYLGIRRLPVLMCSPLRTDRKPSFSFYSPNGKDVNYMDWSTGDHGTIWKFLMLKWNMTFKEVLSAVSKDISMPIPWKKGKTRVRSNDNPVELKCLVRDWEEYDLSYWESYGITLPWLKYADIYPVKYLVFSDGATSFTTGVDKYAYAYVERKEGKVTLKIYQPFSSTHKWINKHDRSVISLWTKVPEYGKRIFICSSMKDALCLWANTGIPAVAIQGEGYPVSITAQDELKRRYDNVYILLDNDESGLKDGIKLSEDTGFTNLVLPDMGAKDISDFYKMFGKKMLIKTITDLLN